MRTACKFLTTLVVLSVSSVALAQKPDPFGGDSAAPSGKDPFAKPTNSVAPQTAGKQTPPAAGKQTADSPRMWTTAEQRIRTVLSEKTAVTFVETPLSEASQQLSQMHDIPIIVDTRALEEIGIANDTPLSLSLTGVSLRSALRLMLHDVDLTFIIKDEVLQITTKEVAEKNLTLATYVFPAAIADKSDKVLDALTKTVQPDQWSTLGGPCSVAEIDNVLVVSATQDVHEEIVEFMEKLRAAFEPRNATK